MIDQYEQFYKNIFKKIDKSHSDNILLIKDDNFINGANYWIKEFLVWGEINKQNTLVLTENPRIYENKIPRFTIKKNGSINITHSKYSKKIEYIKIIDINEKQEDEEEEENKELSKGERILNIVKDFHDNNLIDYQDKRLFRIVIDLNEVLNSKILHNLKNYSRKTNISLLISSYNEERIEKYFMYFDKVFYLNDLDFNMDDTNGTIKVFKNSHIDCFSLENIYGLGSKKVFFWGLKKNGELKFRDIDITGII